MNEVEVILKELLSEDWNLEKEDCDVTRLSDLIESLMSLLGREDISGDVYELVKTGAMSEGQGCVILRVASWSGEEEGRGMNETFRRWLREGLDRTKIKLALSAEVFLFSSYEESRAVYGAIAQRFPDLRDDCDAILSEYR